MPQSANEQVVVGDIPAQRPGFQPRLDVLAQLNRASQGPVVVLTGACGVGKTQLAAAYARARVAVGWRLIAWINAWDSESVPAGMAKIAEATGLDDGRSWQGTADAVRRRLEADGSRSLLVFDGANDPGPLRPFVPAPGAAHVLITAAGEQVADLGASVQVNVFSAEEALALLGERAGLTDEASAAAVAAVVGHLPLALDLAAAAITRQHLGYTDYLARLRGVPAGEYAIEPPYPPGAVAAVVVSLETAEAADPLGVCTAVMERMAVLSPATVRLDLLRAAGQAGTLLGGGRRVAAFMVDEALKALNERSLLGFSLDGQAISVHCLVARVVRAGLARRGRLSAACRAAASTVEASAEALVEPWDHAAVRELLGQVTALLENAGPYANDTNEQLASSLMRLRLMCGQPVRDLPA